MIRLIAALLLLPTLLWAQEYPALHDVTDVASDDVLNIRAEATSGAPIVGTLVHNATDVEVIAADGRWGRVNTGEGSGWVSLRYLARQEPNPDYSLAQRLSCYGTEPFWSADIVQGQRVQFSTPAGDYETPGAGLMVSASGVPGLWALAYGDSVATFRREECSDGMSDRLFGLSVAVFKRHGGEVSLLSGCCSITGY
ncbi:SH3 domain-containing protein [Shimia sp. Alg240-R146]|uniref:SH3 domain-containing protein n=1 Tax=Shimia sp. Alg240-R146 TaxID=2993449 RepID=UPI0022E5A3D1|nr:SH3 domain-containing protein [Shimia sp. Alg240-R146]